MKVRCAAPALHSCLLFAHKSCSKGHPDDASGSTDALLARTGVSREIWLRTHNVWLDGSAALDPDGSILRFRRAVIGVPLTFLRMGNAINAPMEVTDMGALLPKTLCMRGGDNC